MSYLESMFQLGLHSAVPSQGAFEGLPNRAPCPVPRGAVCFGPSGEGTVVLGPLLQDVNQEGGQCPREPVECKQLGLGSRASPWEGKSSTGPQATSDLGGTEQSFQCPGTEQAREPGPCKHLALPSYSPPSPAPHPRDRLANNRGNQQQAARGI